MYLGNSCITYTHKTPRLRVSLDHRYPQIIEQCKQAMKIVCPLNLTSILRYKTQNSVEVYNYSGLWLNFFPQHRAGEKHKRKIELEA